MYDNAKSCVRKGSQLSEFFNSNVNPVFTFNGEVIDIEDDFTYLGIVFMSNGSFCKNKSKLVNQGRKALYSILKKSRKLNLPIDL